MYDFFVRILLLFEDTITRYSVKPEIIVGNACDSKENYDLINLVMIGLSRDDKSESNGLLHFLKVIFSQQYNADEKQDILEKDFGIAKTETVIRGVSESNNMERL